MSKNLKMSPSKYTYMCLKCRTPAELMCARCYGAYCSNDCQIGDWLEHKVVCKPMSYLRKSNGFDDNSGDDGDDELMADDLVVTRRKRSVPKVTKSPDQLKAEKFIEVLSSRPPLQQYTEAHAEELLKKFVNSPVEIIRNLLKAYSGKNSSKQVHVLADIKIVPLRQGCNVPLVITDASFIEQCVVTVVDCESQGRTEINKILSKMADYCQKVKRNNRGYDPAENEVCLVMNEADGGWYRACFLAKKSEGDKHTGHFIDVGKIAEIAKDNIMPITTEFMFPTCANVCQIDNLKEQDIPKLKAYIDKNPLVYADVSKMKNIHLYHICIKNLDKILK